eukprot:Em0015g755a
MAENQSAPGPGLAREESCVFCKIVSKEAPAEILYADDEFVCFRDVHPAAPHHYLVVPRNHMSDPKSLTHEHLPMVERMVEVGKQVLSQQRANVRDSRVGFHWPPFVIVRHLHLHVLSPVGEMSWFNRTLLFREDSFTFVTATWLVDHLKNSAPPS